MIRLAPPVAALLALSSCSGYEGEEDDLGAVSQSEAEALDDAAEMLEQRRLPDGVLADEDQAASAAHDAHEGRMPAGAALQESGGPEPMELPR